LNAVQTLGLIHAVLFNVASWWELDTVWCLPFEKKEQS